MPAWLRPNPCLQGNEYLDFLSAYSAVNQGHCHPKIVGALIEQAQRLTLSSRAFYNDVFPVFSKFVTEVCLEPLLKTAPRLPGPLAKHAVRSTSDSTWSSR